MGDWSMEDAAREVQGWDLSLTLSVISTLVACLALIRPEIATQIRRLLNRLEFCPAGRLEIGFSNLGPTVGIYGTLVGHHNNQLVTSMQLKIVRNRDNATHLFRWAILRSTNFAQSAQQLEFAAAFMVHSAEPRKINIQFHDEITRDHFLDDLINLQQSFRTYLADNSIILATKNEQELQEIRDDFRTANNSLFFETFKKLGDFFYWEKGRYNVTLSIWTKNPKKEFRQQFEFSLSEEESKLLLANRIAILEESAQAKNVIYNFAAAKYE
jgi:hypothetical protein